MTQGSSMLTPSGTIVGPEVVAEVLQTLRAQKAFGSGSESQPDNEITTGTDLDSEIGINEENDNSLYLYQQLEERFEQELTEIGMYYFYS